jgi:uncharacterized protein YdeI (YjbR/CyaY-like superfamily)
MALSITEILYAPDRTSWRLWLEENHSQKREIWLVYFKKHTGKPTVSYDEAVCEALCFGWIDGIEKSLDGQRYAQRFTPRREKSNWSQSNIKRYQSLLKENLVTEAGKKAFANQEKNIK